MASVNAITFASLSDLTVSQAIDTNFGLLLAERNALPRHPALYFTEPIDARGTNVIKVPFVGLNSYNVPAAFADGASVPNTALSTGSATITVVRQAMSRSATDLARMVQPDGRISTAAFAYDAVRSHATRLTDLICSVISTFTTTAGPGSGVALDVVSVMAMIGAGRVNNLQSGAYMGVLHGQQWNHLIQDAGTSLGTAPGGTQLYNPQLAAIQFLRGDSYIGSWLGVDWFVNNRVVNTNGTTDRAGALLSYGGVLVGQGLFTGVVEDPTNQFLIGSMMGADGESIGAVTLVERDREASIGETAIVSSSYLGVSKGIEAGITLISKAAA